MKYPTLSIGAAGEPVRLLHRALGRAGAFVPLPISPKFSGATFTAVRAFQVAAGIVADGIVGPVTWGALAKRGWVPTTPSPMPTSVLVEFARGTAPAVAVGPKGTSLSSTSTDLAAVNAAISSADITTGSVALALPPEIKGALDAISGADPHLPFIGDFIRLDTASFSAAGKLASALSAIAAVRSVDLDAGATTLSTDPFLGSSDQIDPKMSKPNQWYLYRIGADKAWKKSVGANVALFVVDSGFRVDHVDLAGRFDMSLSRRVDIGAQGQFSLSSLSTPATGAARLSHGTQVAGLAGAAFNNGVGIAGVAHGSTLIGVEVGDATNSACLAAAIAYAAVAPTSLPRVINVSMGYSYGYKESYVRHDGSVETANLTGHAIAETMSLVRLVAAIATRLGHVVCFAAGNNARDAGLDFKGAPIPDTGSIVTSATYYDATTNPLAAEFAYGTRVDVLAPGARVGHITAPHSQTPNDWGAFDEGTSLASPQTAGVAALIRSVRPSLTPAQVRGIIRTHTSPHTVLHGVPLGPGGPRFLNAEACVNAALALPA